MNRDQEKRRSLYWNKK